MRGRKDSKLLNNTIMMYLLSITKLIVPLISLPYLTRVLSVECYGSVSFVKSIIIHLQVLVDFGFVYSGTKEIIKLLDDKEKVNREVGNILYAQLLLSIIAIAIMIICCLFMDILEGFVLFSLLSLVSVVLSILLFEYVFRAVEKMSVITIRFVVMKVLALILTIVFVKGDGDVFLIPVFDIISSFIATIPVFIELKKLDIKCKVSLKKIKEAWVSLKKSFEYFLMNLSAILFSSFNTIMIGLVLTKTDVAHWSLTMQLVSAVSVLYNPIISSVYPVMIKEKNLNLIHKILLVYSPLIIIGSIIVWLFADEVVEFVFTDSYLQSARLFKLLIPVLIVMFPAMLYGIPCFSAINKQKNNTMLTVIVSILQVFGIIMLIIVNRFTLVNIIIIRIVAEIILSVTRIIFVYKNKYYFNKINLEEKSEFNGEGVSKIT